MLPLSFVAEPGAFGEVAGDLLPESLSASVVLALGVGAGTLLLGTALAALVSFWDFPGRALAGLGPVLPLAMPGYVLVFVLLGQYDASSELQRGLRAVFGQGFQLPEIRSTVGTIAVLTLVLYPYVYALARASFLGQSRDVLEAARSLGMSHRRAVARVAVPMARPALAAGAALAMMEALADFGAVNLLGYRAMTDAIYRVWYGTYDQAAALQLATVLVGLTATLVVLERLMRGRARYLGALTRGEAVEPRRLRGVAAVAAPVLPALLLLVVLVAPLAQLVIWSVDSLGEGVAAADLGEAAVLTLMLAAIAALVTVAGATLVVYARRRNPSPATRLSARLGLVGYAVPGTVVVVAVFVPLAWVDHRLNDAADALLGLDIGARRDGLGARAGGRLRGQVPGACDRFCRNPDGPRGRIDRRRRTEPRRGAPASAHRGAPPTALAGLGDGRAAGLRRGDEGAAGHRPAAPAGRRHARRGGLGGDQGLTLRHSCPARPDDRARRPGARSRDDATGPHDRARARGNERYSTGIPWRIVFSVTMCGSTNWSR